MSFSGIKTQVAEIVRTRGPLSTSDTADLCATFQRTVTGVLTKKLIAAALRENVEHVVIGGGVAANRELRERVSAEATKHGLRAHVPALASCTYNAAMIAYAGMQRIAAHERDEWDLVATSQSVLSISTRKGRGKR